MKSSGIQAPLLGLVLGGCGQLFGYPEPVAEQGVELCQDAVDNDLDGKTDCEDPNCLGSCPEETLTDCSDAQDNDGDGMTDADDPRCWLHSSPVTQRCAKSEGTDITEHFDVMPRFWLEGSPDLTPSYDWPWAVWGYEDEALIVRSEAYVAGQRRDRAMAFRGNTAGSARARDSLAALVRQNPFSGSWQGLELAFSAWVPEGGILRAGVVPVALAPGSAPPLPGAESALVSLSLDASEGAPVLTWVVEGLIFEGPLAAFEPFCDEGPCAERMVRVNLTVDAEGLLARVTQPGGGVTELRAPLGSLSLPPARLVFWGGSPSGQPGPLLDDVRATVELAELPCGIVVPQIPGGLCQADANQRAHGYSTAVARGTNEHCALVGSSQWVVDIGGLGPPGRVGMWSSPDGDAWTSVLSLSPPEEGLTLVGAGIAADESGYHAAMAYRNDQEGAAEEGVQLHFQDGSTCRIWGASEPGPLLPADAEAPSYVIRGASHEVYFTRPPTNALRRTLWRVLREAPEMPPQQLAELPPGVGRPVSAQLAGTTDLVLAYPSTADSGGKGVGLLVADRDLRDWQKVGSAPVLPLPPSPDLPSGQGRLGFDDREVFSAALSWRPEGSFLLYGARSTGGVSGGEVGTPTLMVGTARIAAAGHVFPDVATVLAEPCGDGVCGPAETCSSCGADCLCSGVEVLDDVLSPEVLWQVFPEDPDARAVRYLTRDPATLTLGGGIEPTWSALELSEAIVGDFELSFDALVELIDDDKPSRLYVGLGTPPEPSESSPFLSPRTGAFALVVSCNWSFYPTPVVLQGGAAFTVAEDLTAFCWEWVAQLHGNWHHVRLTRTGNILTTTVQAGSWQIEAEGLEACGLESKSVAYLGALEPLSHLLVGFGGDGFEPSPPNSNPVTIANLRLRLVDDPDACPPSKVRCEETGQQATCVNTSNTIEHCGACGQACTMGQTCVGGQCQCPGLECDGTCVDPDTSLEHCGACNSVCDWRCVAGACEPLPAACTDPFTIPEAGGNLSLVLDAAESGNLSLCDTFSMGELIGTWTPVESGTAIVEVIAVESSPAAAILDPVVAVGAPGACTTWLDCDDDAEAGIHLDPHLTFPVVAGATYSIAVGMWDYTEYDLPKVEQATVELSIQLDP